ncbi:MAG: tetratricopeptide repeat protein, partial [Vicinamibacterales bacterium]
MKRRILLLGAALCVSVANVFGQTAMADALAAEQAGRWADAIRLYGQLVAAEPRRADLWLRLADLHARTGDREACIAALQRAVDASPSDASVFARLSQAYAWADQPVAALSAIEGALALKPDVPEYLRAKATLATWAGRYHAAGDAYRRLGRSLLDDPEVSLGLARVSAWAGETDAAVDAYRRYLAVHPEAGAAWLELARTESWRGNYAAALDALDDYHARFGPSREYTRERADVLARGGRPTQAARLSTSLLLDEPDSPRDNLTRAIALAMRQQAREALESLNS